MIKQILFDCAGVLTEMNFRGMMLKLSGSEEIADCFVSHLWSPDSPWHLYDKGELDTQQIVEELRKFMPVELHAYLQEFIEVFPDVFPPMAGMEEMVDALHARGYRCYLLSNFPACFEEMLRRTPVLQKLDGMVVSYRIHMLKPDPATFLKAAQILGIDPAETVFIDDSLPNVEGAKKAGMEAYHFTSPADLTAYFRTLGILN